MVNGFNRNNKEKLVPNPNGDLWEEAFELREQLSKPSIVKSQQRRQGNQGAQGARSSWSVRRTLERALCSRSWLHLAQASCRHRFFVFWLFLFLWLAVPWLSEQRTWHLCHVRPLLTRVTLSTRSSRPFSFVFARSPDDPLLRMPSSILGVVSVFAPVELPLTFLRLFVLCWGLDSTFTHH